MMQSGGAAEKYPQTKLDYTCCAPPNYILMHLSSRLVQTFLDHPLGLCGQNDPAKIVLSVEDPEQRLNILTLGVVLDINPLRPERWSRLAAAAGSWLLDPSQVAYQSSQQVQTVMQEMRLLGPRHIPRVWWQICRGVQGRFKGSWRDLIAANENRAQTLQSYLGQNKTTFPVLSGPVISVRWLDLVHRIGGLPLLDWETLRLPLPPGLRETARLFGVETDDVPPLLFAALYTWSTACQKQQDDACGFSSCPKKTK